MKLNSLALLASIPPIRRTLSAISIILSLAFAFAAFGVQLGTSWTYQGQLRRSGTAYNGSCNFQFVLWNAVSGGSPTSGTVAINSVNVANGLFTVELDFGDAFKGEARWLATAVQCSGDGGFTPLEPRQSLTGTPYALSLRPGARIEGGATLAGALSASNTGGGWGLEGTGSPGVFGNSPGGSGVYGQSVGVNSAGVFGFNSTGTAVWGRSTGTGSAIFGENTGSGLAGRFVGAVSIPNIVGAVNIDGPLVVTDTRQNKFAAVDGRSYVGVFGKSVAPGGAGVHGESSGTNGAAVYGLSLAPGAYAGNFEGDVRVTGTLTKGAGSFRIDHPLDPANKFLSHSFVESPDMMNIYNGNTTTDANGSATVTLPDYFAALNRDCRYQLTVLGQFAQAIVFREIAGNSFEIRTDKPGVKVSWQVTGIRQDVYAKAHPIVVEDFKPAEEKGLYLYPAGFGAGEEKSLGRLSRPETSQTEQKITKETK